MIDPVSAAQAAGALGTITNGMAGMSLADAYNAKMDSTYNDASGVSIGVGNWTEDKPAISGNAGNSIYDSSESTAQEAWLDWMHNNPDLVDDTTGGASLGSNVKTINYSLLDTVVGSSPVVQAVQPVAVPLEYAILGISQALGVSMDITQMETETKRAISDSFLELGGQMYDKARNLAMAWWDGVNILFPKKSVQAMADTFEEMGVGSEGGYVSDSVSPSHFEGPVLTVNGWQCDDNSYTYTYTSSLPVILFYDGSRVVPVIASPVQYTEWHLKQVRKSDGRVITDSDYSSSSPTRIVIDGISAYYSTYSWQVDWRMLNPPRSSWNRYVDGASVISTVDTNAVWIVVNGRHISGGYPEGTEESEAQKYTPDTLVSPGGIATGPNTTEPVVQISLPASATSTIGSTADPGDPTDPNRVKDLPAPPIPVPIPDTNTGNPDIGLSNPSKVDEEVAEKIDELVEDLANTLDPQPPQSDGIIGAPYMPGTPVYDPTTGEQTGTSYPSIVPSSGSGLIHVYNPTPGEFISFGQWLWVTYADATIDKIWNNPFDGIIGAFELYSTPSTDGSDNIRSGFLVCPTTAALVRQRYTEIDCGTVIVPEFYGNYLDYSPYSQCYIYLPFIGINEVSIDDIVGHAVNIRYRVDAYNGSCIAMIYVAKDGYENLCYQFAGNCGVEVPLAGGSQAAIKAGMMQAEAYGRAAVQSAQIQKTASIGTGIVNGASAGAGAGAMNPVAGIVGGLLGALAGGTSGYIQGSADYGAAKLSAGAMQEAARVANKSSVQHSGSFGSSHGAMGNKIPFLIIRTPIQVKVVNYNDDYGFPAHKRVIIGGCTGYLRVREVNVISAFATNEEKIAIEEALKNGVYVT